MAAISHNNNANTTNYSNDKQVDTQSRSDSASHCAICNRSGHNTENCLKLAVNSTNDFLEKLIAKRKRNPSPNRDRDSNKKQTNFNSDSATKFVIPKIENNKPIQIPTKVNLANNESKDQDESDDSSEYYVDPRTSSYGSSTK
jgi:hypothetical protein